MKTIELPIPPSVNHLYGLTCRGGYVRKYITEDGRAWFDMAAYSLGAHRGKIIKGQLSLYVKLYTARRRDVDNVLKALQDLLVKARVIEDDSQIVFLQIEKVKVHTLKEEKITLEYVISE